MKRDNVQDQLLSDCDLNLRKIYVNLCRMTVPEGLQVTDILKLIADDRTSETAVYDGE
jgi:hypothetical protein